MRNDTNCEYSHGRVRSALFACYQLDFLIPGIMPSLASSRKQILHKSKSLIYPRFRPHRKHLRTIRLLYFGFFNALAITDFFATINTLSVSAEFCNKSSWPANAGNNRRLIVGSSATVKRI